MDNTLMLGTSPTAVGSPALAFHDAVREEENVSKENDSVGFQELLSEIPHVIQQRKDLNVPAGSIYDPVQQLFE